MSDLITIKGIKSFGYHGVYEFERRDGQDFYVDIEVALNLQEASKSDNLDDSIDYGLLTTIAREEIEGEPVNLIERLAGKIADRIILQFPQSRSVSVTVHKPSAPVSEDFADIAVTVVRP